MFTLTEANWSFTPDAIVVNCRNWKEAKRRLDYEYESWADVAAMWQCSYALLRYPSRSGEIKEFPVIASGESETCNSQGSKMTVITTDTSRRLYNHPDMAICPELRRLVDVFCESDRPMFLLSNEDDRQLWVNQLACDMIESSGEEAIQRSIRKYWEAESHRQLHLKLRDTSLPFDHSYQAILNDRNPTTWFSARSHYTPIEINGRSYRISVNQHFEIIGQAQLQTAR